MTQVRPDIGSLLSGKIGEMVIAQLNGKFYVRSAPKRTKDSNTPNMLRNQKRFKEVISFCGQFKSTLIPQIWNDLDEKSVGYKLFMKANMPAFGKDGSITDVKMLRLSTGNLTIPDGFEARRSETEANTIEVKWPKDLHLGGKHLKDELLVISAAGGKFSEITDTDILRGALTGSFELPAKPTPATHIYLFFGSKDRRNYSQSVCFEV